MMWGALLRLALARWPTLVVLFPPWVVEQGVRWQPRDVVLMHPGLPEQMPPVLLARFLTTERAVAQLSAAAALRTKGILPF